MRAQQAAEMSPRKIYLQTIGLERFDPFAMPVAELELNFTALNRLHESSSVIQQGIRSPQFYDFFVPPPLHSQPPVADIRRTLHEPSTAAVFGRPGDGKTTLRLVLESDCRRDTDRILAVSYLLEEDLQLPIAASAHWQRLAESLALDLIIQIVERFNPLDQDPTTAQIEALGVQIAIGGRVAHRLVDRILDEPEPRSIYGLSAHWSLARRPVVKRVVSSRKLVDLLSAALRNLPGDLPRDESALLAGLSAARLWNFERCFVLLDGVDTHTRRRDTQFMLELLTPLVQALPQLEKQQLWFKLFLPDTLQQSVSDALQQLTSNLTFPSVTFIMDPWQSRDFRQLLIERFRVAGSRRVGFDDLAAATMPDSLDQLLFQAAQGSPRRLLQLISALIDAHVARDPHDRFLNPDDWNTMRAHWSGEIPPPPALKAT